jgi:hypothetical protein
MMAEDQFDVWYGVPTASRRRHRVRLPRPVACLAAHRAAVSLLPTIPPRRRFALDSGPSPRDGGGR